MNLPELRFTAAELRQSQGHSAVFASYAAEFHRAALQLPEVTATDWEWDAGFAKASSALDYLTPVLLACVGVFFLGDPSEPAPPGHQELKERVSYRGQVESAIPPERLTQLRDDIEWALAAGVTSFFQLGGAHDRPPARDDPGYATLDHARLSVYWLATCRYVSRARRKVGKDRRRWLELLFDRVVRPRASELDRVGPQLPRWRRWRARRYWRQLFWYGFLLSQMADRMAAAGNETEDPSAQAT